MRIHLERFGFGTDSTLGRLYVPGQEPVWTLEDEYRERKVQGETCIPYGTYDVKLRTVGGFHARYGDRYPEMHRGMLWLRDVHGFEFILFHAGNTDDDTAGCILVGESGRMDHLGEFSIGRSRDAYERIYPIIARAVEDQGCEIRVARRWDQTEQG